jgi:hypothetical protein
MNFRKPASCVTSIAFRGMAGDAACPRLRSLIRSAAAISLLMLTIASGAAAQSAGPTIPLSDADRGQLDALLGAGVVGEALPSAPLGNPASYLPRLGKTLTYQVVTQGKKPAIEIHEIAETTDAAFKPGWHYTVGNAGEMYIQKDPAGRALTSAEKDLDTKVLSRFIPGDPLILTGLQPGQSVSSSHKVEVYDLSNLTQISHSGSLDITYSHLGTFRVTVPAGTFDAALVKWSYSGKIGPANIKDSQYRFFAPNVGMVAMIQIRSISALLVYNDHTKRGKLLARQ